MEKDALNRILRDPKLAPEEFSVYYVDRLNGRLSKANFPDIRLAGEFFE
ncbi:MAG: hypothetical protein JW724_08130 [Candidatus Altiarchaeota archaeon]|nr:hypothetical protein [Candidatus Altiarchaeota archaeon]